MSYFELAYYIFNYKRLVVEMCQNVLKPRGTDNYAEGVISLQFP